MTGAPTRRVQRRDIQGLRMIAVLIVIANHATGWPVGGFVGVDVFFVISGFLITGLLVREHRRTGRISFVDFYRRRIKRLMPAALLVLAVTVVAGAFLLPQGRAVSAAIDAIFAALFTVNWRLAAVGTDYFEAGQSPSPLQHYWSLSVEEQFYVVWPIIMVLVLWAASRIARGRGRDGFLLLTATALTAASLAWALHETTAAPDIAYFSTLSRAWELGIGAILAIVVETTRVRIPGGLAPWAGLAGTLGILASCFLVQPQPGFPAPTGLLPVVSTALVIWAGVEGGRAYERVNALLTNRVAQFLGDISYSLYLWHFPVIVLGAALLPQGSPQLVLVAVAVTLLLSWASFRFVEDPARRSAWLTPQWRWRRRTAVAWVAVGALVVTGGVAAGAQLSQPVREVEAAEVAEADCFGAAFILNGCTDADLTGEIAPTVDVLAEDDGGAYECWRRQGAELRSCTYGDESEGATRVAIVGDSHAAMLMPALRPRLEERGWRLDTYLGYGCQWRLDNPESDCAAVMEQMHAELLDGEYDVILTSAARWAQGDATPGFTAAWSEAAAGGARVIAVEDAPTVSEEAYACVQRVVVDTRGDECSTPVEAAAEPHDELPDAARATTGAASVPVMDLYCSEVDCPAIIGGVAVYRDTVGHITATYMETLADELLDRIDAAAAP